MPFEVHNPPSLSQGTVAQYVERQRVWSEETFGPGDRTDGIVDHIQKELMEIEDDPNDLMEWVDVIILAIDGLWRALINRQGVHSRAVGSVVSDMLEKKYLTNEARQWPDWRTAKPAKAIEHIRTAEEQKPTVRSDKPPVDSMTFLRQSFESALLALQTDDCTEAAIQDVQAGLRHLDEMKQTVEEINQLLIKIELSKN